MIKPMADMDGEERLAFIAIVAHDALWRYRLALGEPDAGASWADSPEAIQDRILAGVMTIFHNPDLSPKQLHAKWSEWLTNDGWTFGPTKDLARKTHPNLRPWEDLPLEQRLKDALFAGVVRSLFGADQ